MKQPLDVRSCSTVISAVPQQQRWGQPKIDSSHGNPTMPKKYQIAEIPFPRSVTDWIDP